MVVCVSFCLTNYGQCNPYNTKFTNKHSNVYCYQHKPNGFVMFCAMLAYGTTNHQSQLLREFST